MRSTVVLSDGSTVSGERRHVDRAVAIDREMRLSERAWIVRLRNLGIRAAHPDDGWVKRDEGKVHLCYPQFNDGVGEGDLLALGWPWSKVRIVRVVDRSDLGPIGAGLVPSPFWWHFKEVR